MQWDGTSLSTAQAVMGVRGFQAALLAETGLGCETDSSSMWVETHPVGKLG